MSIKERIQGLSARAKGSIAAIGTAVATGATSAMTAHAEVPAEMKQAMETAFTGIKSDTVSFMSIALPAALSIMGISIAVTLGIHFFKKFKG